ncbi:rod shape-determining protein MreD [Bizionia echini]|uniref:Rod shape-determining protein MreD n=1 Tax=Bizionia echini TaxID=649333 RepID=A0A1I4ZZ82_9FLAO|nr:rod shape-determining protein MreD [Bizionia echini]MBP93114.1 rod shape-determining protein MreD [Flavobacteriaceae bacterium]SFN55458.1 rod shape-determining protein MreD [Bizionia echini]|tara:strand:- start:129 stop:632 length:504 start_codon:yes stop_codon:yes gene_type:complete
MKINVISYSVQFIVLILAQVLVLNHINFLGYINPYLYVIFVLLFPVNNNRLIFLLLSFALGLTIDLFSDSGGIHAAAALTIAFIRPVVLKFCFGSVYEHHTIKFKNVDFGAKVIYFVILVLIHHFILFALEIFNLKDIILVLQKTLFSSIFTIILCLIATILFSRKT